METLLISTLKEMTEKHGCHTVILYGSHARGDWTNESDLDVIGFRAMGDKFRDARIVEGLYLDAFVYPESDVLGNEANFLRLRGGQVLMEKEGFGENLLQRLNTIFAQGPEPLPADELQARRIWIDKMLGRISKGDTEGNYRRSWLLFALLEDYFSLRGLWYLGPKESFRWLAENDPETLEAFQAALRTGASPADLRHLAERVKET